MPAGLTSAHWEAIQRDFETWVRALMRSVVVCASPETFARTCAGLGPGALHFDYTQPRLNRDLGNLASVVAAAAFTVSLDSGTAHLASLLRSRIASWLGDPAQGARAHNAADRLLREVLFAVHDYLHIWAYRVLRERRPDLSFASLPGEVIDFEDLIFCHLLTEAVAVAGLDYWYLSCVELNDRADGSPAGQPDRSRCGNPTHRRRARPLARSVRSPGSPRARRRAARGAASRHELRMCDHLVVRRGRGAVRVVVVLTLAP